MIQHRTTHRETPAARTMISRGAGHGCVSGDGTNRGSSGRRRQPITKTTSVAQCIAALVGESFADTVTMEEAIKNDRLGLPAFWHRGIGGKSCWFAAQIANDQGDLAPALEWAKEMETHHPYVSRAFMLDRLVPLNRAAVDQMRAAYAELGLWRDDLHARRPA